MNPSPEIDDLLLWQIADSAFPTGSFAHSGGLEASFQRGQVDNQGLADWVQTQLLAASRATLPFVSAAWNSPDALERIDRECDLFLNNHVANRASRRRATRFSQPPSARSTVPTFGRFPKNHAIDRLISRLSSEPSWRSSAATVRPPPDSIYS